MEPKRFQVDLISAGRLFIMDCLDFGPLVLSTLSLTESFPFIILFLNFPEPSIDYNFTTVFVELLSF